VIIPRRALESFAEGELRFDPEEVGLLSTQLYRVERSRDRGVMLFFNENDRAALIANDW